MKYVTSADYQYAVQCRRHLHRHPEQLFELDQTVAFVRTELERMGIACSEAGPASVVGYIGPEDAQTTIGIRADMDALPIEEKTGLPYASVHPGLMHACGHDSHTAVLLTVAQVLKRHEAEMNVRVKLLFQPSEEGAESGAKSMVEHGAMDDVDWILAAHCDNELKTGTIGCCAGGYMTASTLIKVVFRGRKAHAAKPEQGIDAIAMGWEAYGSLKQLVAEAAGDRMCIFGINCVSGGTAPNTVADRCEMTIAFRYYDTELYECVRRLCTSKCEEIAARFGGTAELHWHTSAPPVYNAPKLVARFLASTEAALPGRAAAIPPVKLSEDFSWFLEKKPGFLFRFGTGNEALGCLAPLHSPDFNIDEQGMEAAVEAFAAFIMREE